MAVKVQVRSKGLGVFAVGLVSVLLLGACTSTGNSFNSSGIHRLVPGETTMEQAVAALGADPVNSYRQLDGSAMMVWSHKNSMLTDALYLNQELWLAFGPEGRFQRIVKKVNLPPAPAPASPPDPHPMTMAQGQAPLSLSPSIVEPASSAVPPAVQHANQPPGPPAVSFPINQVYQISPTL